MQSSTPTCSVNTPRRDLRLRGMPPHIVEVFTKLESSVRSSENSDATPDTPKTDMTFTERIYALLTRLLEFVSDADRMKAENTVLRMSIREAKQKNEKKEDGLLREITRMKISLEEANAETQNLRNDLEHYNADAETLRQRIIELERENLTLERKCQNSEQQCQKLRTNLNKILLEKTEIKGSRNDMEVELASERNRGNILASELRKALQELENSKTHQPGAADVTLPQECLSCAQRLSLEGKFIQKIETLEAELESSKKGAEENDKKLQALAEELRVRVLKEKARAQKLARRNSQLAAERVSASQQLKAVEDVLNKACSKTFHGDAQEDSQLDDAVLQADEPITREEVLLRRLGLYRETNSILHSSMQQNCELPDECKLM